MSSSRHVRVTRTTELPSKTYHITKHHYQPIRYQPGVEVLRQPDVEHKVITSGSGIEGGSAYRGPRAKNIVTIQRTSGPAGGDRLMSPSSKTTRHVTRSYTGGGGAPVEQTYSSSDPPESFVNLQKSMETELDRRRNTWETDVERMQHNFFDMKTSDVSKDKQSDLKSRGGGGGPEILTVGDSRSLFHELPDGSRVYRQKFDLHGFDTEDLAVRAEDGKLIITASRDEDMGDAKSTRQFNRSVDIPDAVDSDQISSFIDDDGILVIEAPVDESKLRKNEPHVTIKRVEDSALSEEPEFDGFRSQFSPPEYNSVVETSRSSGPAVKSVLSKTRYLGPDVEDTPYGRKLKTSLYIGKKYKPEDITVKLYDYKINVDATSEEIIGGRTSRRKFGRDVDIPGPVERPTFRAVLGDDGRLYLGGSFEGNDDHEGVAGSVTEDMPEHGKSVNIMF